MDGGGFKKNPNTLHVRFLPCGWKLKNPILVLYTFTQMIIIISAYIMQLIVTLSAQQ